MMMKKNLKFQRNIISLKALTKVAFIDFLRSSDLKKSSSHHQFARGKQKSDGRVNIECRLQSSCNYYSLSRKNKYLKMHKLMEYSSLNYFKFENFQENFYFFDIKPELRISELKRKKEILQIQTQPHHLILLIDLKIFR